MLNNFIIKEKGNIDKGELKARDLTNLHIPSIKKYVLLPTYYPNDVINGYQHAMPMEITDSFAKVECEQFYKDCNTDYRRIYDSGNFLQTLWHNIMQK